MFATSLGLPHRSTFPLVVLLMSAFGSYEQASSTSANRQESSLRKVRGTLEHFAMRGEVPCFSLVINSGAGSLVSSTALFPPSINGVSRSLFNRLKLGE